MVEAQQQNSRDYVYKLQQIDHNLYGAIDLATGKTTLIHLRMYSSIQETFQGHDLWKANWTKKTLEEVLKERGKNGNKH